MRIITAFINFENCEDYHYMDAAIRPDFQPKVKLSVQTPYSFQQGIYIMDSHHKKAPLGITSGRFD
jgi:hypothetical protein